MKGYIAKQYKPVEIEAAIAVLRDNDYHLFEESEAKAIVLALHKRGYRIIKTGKQE